MRITAQRLSSSKLLMLAHAPCNSGCKPKQKYSTSGAASASDPKFTLRLSGDEHGIHVFAIDDLDVCKTKQLQSHDRVGLWHYPIGTPLRRLRNAAPILARVHVARGSRARRKTVQLPIQGLTMSFPLLGVFVGIDEETGRRQHAPNFVIDACAIAHS